MYNKQDFFKNYDHKKVRKLKNFYYDQYGITWNEILTIPALNQSLKDVLGMIH
mgnify:CR=1 FL=1